ncbi:NtaA/DmoA family FMN-dependent monooxygenase [Mycobacteroides abscessus]|nr:NtaA/DmoA family FMN-dependent monooxygenase [Mycobacteroides abscessus]MDM1905912.1 NtaA/DmoA family FMN-dependent monooxygenase [Mycobacteroides abscessus]MDM1910689.1 NtaA/DmoA family FMN-dependent monooxygenase [Mycobacteroides abscessus]MDM1919323.1 NtaA/DmoA family FMN-dependent monooxygenase [Mycobacteroides abscessus]
MPRKFHLGWFHNFATDDWLTPNHDPGAPWNGKFFIEFAKTLEKAKFDFLFFADNTQVPDIYGGDYRRTLALGVSAPKHDPVPLVAALSTHTTHLGLVSTMTTSFYPPYLLARAAATIDHLSGGRFGWNIVTGGTDSAAKNFGLDKMPSHDDRYADADEYTSLVRSLWDSSEPEAYVRDREKLVYVDHSKVHEVNFRGERYASRGPLNTLPSPQGNPVLFQAGSSPAGRDFAAKHADGVLGIGGAPAKMKEFRDDIRQRAAGHGRNPDDVKALFGLGPIVGSTDEEARRKHHEWSHNDLYVEKVLESISLFSDIDLAQYDLDSPLPELSTEANTTALKHLAAGGRTLREMATNWGIDRSLVGNPSKVADALQRLSEATGADGFMISAPKVYIDRVYIDDIVEGLVPELQSRGLVRKEYRHEHLRDNLFEY